MSEAAYWFSPAPSEVSSSRVSLDFELRAADLFFRERVVPELGRVWFVRQLSWPVAALALHESLQRRGSSPPKPTAICHGIEALACKLEHAREADEPSRRILGRRAFGRDRERVVWSFQGLRQGTNYVRNTHRQAATKALRHEGGLGFATGTRFDLLELEPVGRALGEAFLEQKVGRGGGSLRRWLIEWLDGERGLDGSPSTLVRALSPEQPTATEQQIVRSRLLETATAAGDTRRHLARAVGQATELPDIEKSVVLRLREAGRQGQANELVAARAFGALLDRTRDAATALTRLIEPERRGVQVAVLAQDATILRSIWELKEAAKRFMERRELAGIDERTSRVYAETVLRQRAEDVIRLVVSRAGGVLLVADGSVIRGPLFRVIDASDSDEDREDEATSIEPDRTGRTFRLSNLHALLGDLESKRAMA